MKRTLIITIETDGDDAYRTMITLNGKIVCNLARAKDADPVMVNALARRIVRLLQDNDHSDPDYWAPVGDADLPSLDDVRGILKPERF